MLVVGFLEMYFFCFYFFYQGDSNDVAVVNESIDLLKSSLEKNEHGFVKVRNNGTVQNEGDCAQGKSSNSALPLASSAANIKDEAAIHMLLACRRNVILSHFFRTGVFSLAAQRQQASQKHLGEFWFSQRNKIQSFVWSSIIGIYCTFFLADSEVQIPSFVYYHCRLL